MAVWDAARSKGLTIEGTEKQRNAHVRTCSIFHIDNTMQYDSSGDCRGRKNQGRS